jgi:hypothetical protein
MLTNSLVSGVGLLVFLWRVIQLQKLFQMQAMLALVAGLLGHSCLCGGLLLSILEVLGVSLETVQDVVLFHSLQKRATLAYL